MPSQPAYTPSRESTRAYASEPRFALGPILIDPSQCESLCGGRPFLLFCLFQRFFSFGGEENAAVKPPTSSISSFTHSCGAPQSIVPSSSSSSVSSPRASSRQSGRGRETRIIREAQSTHILSLTIIPACRDIEAHRDKWQRLSPRDR
jgi:hypothetical protein